MNNDSNNERILDISNQARMTNTSIVDIEGLVNKNSGVSTAEQELKELSKLSKSKKKNNKI